MALNSAQLQDLHHALLDAFPFESDLEMLSYFHLGVNLHQIVSPNANLNKTVLEMVVWCNGHDKIASLLKGAVELNPGNLLLKQFVQDYSVSSPSEVQKSDSIETFQPVSSAKELRESRLLPASLLTSRISDGKKLLARIELISENDYGKFIAILRDTKQWEENIISLLALPPLAVIVSQPYRPLEYPKEIIDPEVFLLYVEDLLRKLQNQIAFLERILVSVQSQEQHQSERGFARTSVPNLHNEEILREIKNQINSLDQILRSISNPTPHPRKDEPAASPIPKKLIMKGGGILGLAYASAIQELEHYYKFDTFVGTSAGAIVACLLGAGHSGSNLCQILSDTDFAELLDNKPFAAWWSELRNGYMHSGLNLENWLIRLIHRKTNLDDPTLSKVGTDKRRIVMFASRVRHGTIAFDSHGQEKDRRAAFAVRCSMSVPVFFESQTIDGDRVYDGGLRNNFPVKAFIEMEDNRGVNIRPHFIALFLGTSEPQGRRKRSTLDEVMSILLEGEDRILVQEYATQTIIIDPTPIGFLQFNLTPDEKRLLVAQGRAAALRFLQEQNLPDGPGNHHVINAIREAEDLKQIVIKQKQRPFWSKWFS